ncbi:unnamed protein product [Rotaria sordida]|uniref:Uncharacterized protein n=1 Tax=Rotaria sordida TaxID=392033 RepID=A0A814G7P1_9BILA|nr:unnamed protein product [Rotaria sordida]
MAYSALPNLDNLNNREWVKLTDGLDNVISFCQISRSISVVRTAGNRSTASGLLMKSAGLMTSFIIPSPSILVQFVMA